MSEHDAHGALMKEALERRARQEAGDRERRKQATQRKPARETTYETKVEEYYK